MSAFDRLALLYQLLMPPANSQALAAGLAYANAPLENILDVGGGTGRAVHSVEVDLGTDVSYRLLVDAARGMISIARETGLEGVQADACVLPFNDRTIDAVLIVDALHHFHRPHCAVTEAARVLRPGGVVVIREFDPTTFRGRVLATIEQVVGFDSTFYAPADLADLVEDVGLTPILPNRGFGYTIVGVKRGD